MNLTSIYRKHFVGINFTEDQSPTLKELGFVDIKLNVDLRDKDAERRLYRKLKKHLSRNDICFMVTPDIKPQILIVNTIIYGLTENLPNIVYFEKKTDPDLLTPKVVDLDSLRYRVRQAAIYNSEYSLA